MPPRIVDKFVDEQCLKLSALHSGSSLNFARSSVNVNSTFPVSQSNCHVIGNHNLATSVSLHLKDGAYVYAKASGKGKRIQCNINSKNHAVVMSDASMDATLNALVAAGFGGVGQKCIALNIVVFVGSLTPWEDKLVEYAKALKVTAGTKPDANLGPVISKQVKERICRLIQANFENGAKLLLDVVDDIFCLFQGHIENVALLKQQY